MTLRRVQTPFELGLIGLTVVVLTVATGCTSTEARAPGQIELSANTFDFGSVPNTDPVSKTFQVRNVGQGTLEILGVSTSCACTTAQLERHQLDPGAMAQLTVTYDPQVHDGATGRFLRVVYVRSSDPDTPEAELTVWVTVVEAKDLGALPAEDALRTRAGAPVNSRLTK